MPPVKEHLESTESTLPGVVPTQKKKGLLGKLLKLSLLFLLLIAVISAVLAVLIVPPVLALKKSGLELKSSFIKLKESAQSKDLNLISETINEIKSKLNNFDTDLSRLSWTKALPWAGKYFTDAQHATTAIKSGLEAGEIVVQTIQPYADIIGLKGQGGAIDGAKTAQDRITFVVETLDKITPQLDSIGTKVAEVSSNLSSIDPARYPQEINGVKVKDAIKQAQSIAHDATILTHDAKPLLEAAPYILGIDKKRTYLALFQNDAELRPTGGFMTAYAVLEVNKGKVKPLFSDDIYALDAKYNPTIKAPDALIKYVSFPYQKDPKWRLRDMNMSADFRDAMETFLPEYNKTGSPKIDGVISVDTQLLLYLLEVIGRIGVPGQGNFSADNDPRCNCPVVIYELESVISVETPYLRTYRKAILGPLMNSIIANAVGQPKEKIAQLMGVFLRSIQEKHLMTYFLDDKIQSSVESFNMAGRIRAYNGDYLYIVSSNLAGAKSNLYVKSDVSDEIQTSKDGSAHHKLTVNFNNPQKYDGWLNGVNRNWFRVYVPQGSKLLDSSGSEVKIDTYEEFGKTVFAGFITVRPSGGVARFTLEYQTPPLPSDSKYSLLIQKQPGTTNNPYVLTINSKEQEIDLNGDKEIR